VRHVANTEPLPPPAEETEEEFTALLLDDLEATILAMGPEDGLLVHMEPVQNAGGAFTPPAGYWRGVRELCDRYDILLSADEVITASARRPLVRVGALRHPAGHRLLREGALVLLRGDRRRRRERPRAGAVPRRLRHVRARDHLRRPPVMCAIALKNIEIMKRERIMEHVLGNEDAFRDTLAQLLDLPIVGDLRGTGFFYALELVKDKETKETFSDEECETLLRGFLSARAVREGAHLPADDRATL
jgi:adenosylmethionine-8-amino-7-oxononanoate aminotransferase